MSNVSPLRPDQFRKGSVSAARINKSQSAKLDAARIFDAPVTDSAYIRAHIDRKWLNTEDVLELTALCWPGYVGLSPFERTELFIAAYQAIYPDKYRQWKGEGRDRGPFQDRLAENTEEVITAFYGARMSADMLGMPYGDYIRLVMDVMLDKGPNRKYLPKPGQLQITMKAGEISWWVGIVLERWVAEGNELQVHAADLTGVVSPDCFGLVKAGNFAACADCVFKDACTTTWEKASGRMVQDYGSTDPRGDRVRAQTRIRVANHRRKEAKLAALERVA